MNYKCLRKEEEKSEEEMLAWLCAHPEECDEWRASGIRCKSTYAETCSAVGDGNHPSGVEYNGVVLRDACSWRSCFTSRRARRTMPSSRPNSAAIWTTSASLERPRLVAWYRDARSMTIFSVASSMPPCSVTSPIRARGIQSAVESHGDFSVSGAPYRSSSGPFAHHWS